MKIGTIGTGNIVEKFISAVNKNQGADVIAVYSRTKDNGEKLAQNMKVEKIYTNMKDMLMDENINCIYVGSPNSLHAQYVKEALEHGKNVICEKPFTSNSNELEHLIQLAKSKKLFLFEAITTIHLPNIAYIKAQLNKLKGIKIVRCNFSQYSQRYEKLINGEMTNAFDTKFSGGALMDLNVYNIHFVLNLFGVPNDVKYFPNIYENGIDTSGIAILKYNDFLAECIGAKDCYSENSCEIQASNGYIKVNSTSSLSSSITVCIDGETVKYTDQYEDNVLYYEVGDFIDIYENNNYDKCYKLLDYSMDVMKVLDKARQSGNINFQADYK